MCTLFYGHLSLTVCALLLYCLYYCLHYCYRVGEEMTRSIQATINNCVDRIKVLFVFKQQLIKSTKDLKSRKLHMLFHSISWIENFGSMLGQDTERWEAYLKQCGKAIYRGSQKRRMNTAELMMAKVRFVLFTDCLHTVTRMIGLENCILGPRNLLH